MRKSGFIMSAVVIVSMSILLFVATFSLSIKYKNEIAFNYINSAKAYYLARTGVAYSKCAKADADFMLPDTNVMIHVKRDSPVRSLRYDVNGDGNVNETDNPRNFTGATRGTYAYNLKYDLNKSGTVNTQDMIYWRNNVTTNNIVCPDQFKIITTSTAVVNGRERKIITEEESNDFSRRHLYKNPVVKWE